MADCVNVSPGCGVEVCPNNKISKHCVEGCDENCNFLRNSETCRKDGKCENKCGCSSGLFNNGTHCVPPSSCECYDKTNDKIHQPGVPWESGCSTCVCFNNTILCNKNPCKSVFCPSPEYRLVEKEGLCCPVCEKVPQLKCRDDQFDCQNGTCIPLSWVCDREKDCAIDEKDCNPDNYPEPCNFNLGMFLFYFLICFTSRLHKPFSLCACLHGQVSVCPFACVYMCLCGFLCMCVFVCVCVC